MKQLTNNGIDEIEGALGRELPRFYRKLLIEVGFGASGDIELYHPEEVDELYELKFDDEGLLFNKYFPFGCNNRTQELWIIDVEQDRVASIHHETHEDDWPQEDWKEYELWVPENKT